MIAVHKNEMDLIGGNLFKKVLIFSLPIILSGILQLLYNAADLIVCGMFGSPNSVGAISSTGALINAIIQLFMGLSVGANVLMSRCFGVNDKEKGQRIAYTAMITSFAFGIILAVFGTLCSGYFLEWMKTTSDVIGLAKQYIIIYFLGSPFSLVYNFGASLLRAVGDTKRPFYFLAIAGIFNVLFNLLFVIVFKMDVAGVALGTILSQAISAVCVVVCLVKNKGFFSFSFRKMRFYKTEAIEMTKVGLPAGVQGVIFSMSNVLIQSSVNSLGTLTTNANGAACSIEGFVYTIMNAVAQACIAFVSANFAAGKWGNIKKSVWFTMVYVCVFGMVAGALAVIFAKPLLSIYVNNPQTSREDIAATIEIAYSRLLVICLTYYLCGFMDVMAYAVRGVGYSILPTIVALCGACGLRILWIYTVFNLEALHSLQGLAISYPISWFVTFSTHTIAFIIVYKKKKRQRIAELEIISQTTEQNN